MLFFVTLECVEPLVRLGKDEYLPCDRFGRSCHTVMPVYKEMLLTCMRLYNCLPNPYDLTMVEIENLYDGIRHELYGITKKTED